MILELEVADVLEIFPDARKEGIVEAKRIRGISSLIYCQQFNVANNSNDITDTIKQFWTEIKADILKFMKKRK